MKMAYGDSISFITILIWGFVRMTLVKKLSLACMTLLAFLSSQAVLATDQFNLTQGATKTSHEVYDLHMLVVKVCISIAVVVFGTMFLSMFLHRKSKHPVPAKFSHSTLVEIIWTTIPFLILVGLAIPATQTLIHIEDNSKSDVDILITGYQWKWQYKYLAEDISFFSSLSTPQSQINGEEEKGEHYLLEVDKPLVIPVGKKVRFLVTSKDVIHSWFVPAFAVKQDAVPGFINEAWTLVDKPGIYRGQCAELCGKDHGFMPIVVEVKSAAEYDAWISEQKIAMEEAKAAAAAAAASSWSKEDLMAKGKEVYDGKCAACHMPNGEGNGPFPALAGSKVANGLAEEHINVVLYGRNNTMPAWKGVITDAEIAAVITYERNSWSNKAGDVIQPAQVAAMSNQQ